MRLLAAAMAVVIAGMGAVGMAAPSLLLDFARTVQTTNALYVVAVVRVVFGVLLLAVAAGSRFPRTLRLIGIVIIVAGILTPFFGVDRAQAVFEWWSSRDSLLVRALASVALVFGIFVAFAVMPRRR